LPTLSTATPLYEFIRTKGKRTEVAPITREARSIRVIRGLGDTNRMDSMLIANRLVAMLSIKGTETRNEPANSFPKNSVAHHTL